LFSITLARLGLTGAYAQVSIGWKEIYAVAERSPCIGIQMCVPCSKSHNFLNMKNIRNARQVLKQLSVELLAENQGLFRGLTHQSSVAG